MKKLGNRLLKLIKKRQRVLRAVDRQIAKRKIEEKQLWLFPKEAEFERAKMKVREEEAEKLRAEKKRIEEDLGIFRNLAIAQGFKKPAREEKQPFWKSKYPLFTTEEVKKRGPAFAEFLERVETKPATIKTKYRRHEGVIDISIGLGNEIYGWFGMEYDNKLSALKTESVQGAAGKSGSDFKDAVGEHWPNLLAQRVIDTARAIGNNRVAIIKWEHQSFAKLARQMADVTELGVVGRSTRILYEMVLRALSKAAMATKSGKKRASVGSYWLFVLK